MALRLHVTSHHAKSEPRFALLHHESRNEGVERTFARRIHIGMSRLHGKQFTSILKSEAETGDDDAGAHAAIITLNDRNHITVLVRNTEISGITLRKLAGAGVIMSSSALLIDKAPALSRVVLGQQRLDRRSGQLCIAIWPGSIFKCQLLSLDH